MPGEREWARRSGSARKEKREIGEEPRGETRDVEACDLAPALDLRVDLTGAAGCVGLARIAKRRRWPLQRFSSRGGPDRVQLTRSALAWASVVPAVATGLGVGLLNRSQREAVNMMTSLWGDLTASLAGIDLRVEGEQHLWSRRPAVFIFNHQSYLDGLLLM